MTKIIVCVKKVISVLYHGALGGVYYFMDEFAWEYSEEISTDLLWLLSLKIRKI
ncbi:MAG UNVERIFIED_CONTAM: hypothetical protein LVR29_20950 [Microcystis novacekii LVE1205-3]